MKTEQKHPLLALAEQKLNKRSLGYFRIMFGQYLVMMLKGKPGTWKSAILKYIADTLGMVFIDLRLPTMDEVDLGCYPVPVQERVGEHNFVVVKMSVPEWAAMTADKSKNFMIVFEELNRTSPAVRNAALGLLLERRIGPHFMFGDNVYMAATGNIGMADGTDVEEFDTALKSRMVPVTHNEELVEWFDSFAETQKDKDGNVTRLGGVHQDIVEYLKTDPTNFYPEMKLQGGNGQSDVITNPRTWTGLSKAIERNFGMDAKVAEYGDFVREHGKSYIGATALRFLKFVEENVSVTLDDIINGKVKDLSKIKRDNKAEILRTFEAFDPNTLKKDVEFERLIAYLKSLDRDLFLGGLLKFAENRIVALGTNKKAGAREKEMSVIFKQEYAYLETKEDEENNKKETK